MKYVGMSAIALAAFGLASCSNELNENDFGINNGGNGSLGGISLVKTPDVMAWSGEQALGATNGVMVASLPSAYNNAGDGDVNNTVWPSYGANSLTNVDDNERNKVLDAIAKKVTGQKMSEDLVFPWTSYFLQDVISGQNGNFTNAGSNGGTSSSYTMEAFNKGAVCDPQGQYNDWEKHNYFQGWNNATNSHDVNPNYEDEHSNYETITNSGHINSYFQKKNSDGSQERINETALMTDMNVGTYEEMKGRQFRWYINCHENLHWSEYIIVKVDGQYYICFDFGCGFPENDKDGHAGKGAEHNDWDYNDWILKITPAGNQPPVWGEELSDNNTPIIPETPTDPEGDDSENPRHNHEVEVNYEIVDSHDYAIADLVTKLSIHVRHATDVDIRIPVPTKYVIESDDLYIFNEHYTTGEYGGSLEDLLEDNTLQTVSYTINGQTVVLTVEFVFDNDDPEGGYFHVTTTGINENVIDYCWENYGDGINFEVWNYYQTEKFNEETNSVESTSDLTREMLKGFLDASTITFTDNPYYYINAFGWDWNGEEYIEIVNPDDCVVTPADSSYRFSHRGYHLNGTPYNDIYVLNGGSPDLWHSPAE